MTDTAKYPEAVLPVWKSGKPTIAPSGATIITGANWGDWNGAIAMAVQKGQHVRILQLDTSGKLLDEMKILTNFGRIRSVVMGPDNTMYFTTDNGKAGDKLVQVTTK